MRGLIGTERLQSAKAVPEQFVVSRHLFGLGLEVIGGDRFLRRRLIGFKIWLGEPQSLSLSRSKVGDPLTRPMRRKKPIDNSGTASPVLP
jgi:hypothetical protein